jgi:pimeloyl-ACP methyl ester carboxylesterase
MEAELRRCLQQLDGDPRQYTTSIAMADYDQVRAAMGYEQINLVGVSYGTRAAQVYLRQFPQRVRSVVLDSVVPMQLALGQEHAPMLDQAVQQVLEQCAGDERCNALYPNHAQELRELFRQLREAPRQTSITNPWTGQPQDILLSADTLAVAVRFLSYSSETQALLPLLVHEALATGQLERLASQAVLVMSGISESIARGMEASVMCSEDYPFMDFNADYSDTLMGGLMLEAIRRQCALWPRGEVADDFHQPVRSDVPVLLLSGERDPVTPPAYASQVAATFPNSLNLVARGQSHSVLRDACLQEVATQFIERASASDLDTACVENIRPAPFFTSLLGPDP